MLPGIYNYPMDPNFRTASPYTDPTVKGPKSQIQAAGIDLRKSKSFAPSMAMTKELASVQTWEANDLNSDF